jgi:hypothetical protein
VWSKSPLLWTTGRMDETSLYRRLATVSEVEKQNVRSGSSTEFSGALGRLRTVIVHVVVRGDVVVVRVVLAVAARPVVGPLLEGVVAQLGVVHVLGVVELAVGVVVVVLVCVEQVWARELKRNGR